MKKKVSLGRKLLDLWDCFQDLPFGRKQMWIFTLLGIVFLFFPWFYDGVAASNAFEKIPGGGFLMAIILGFITFLLGRESFFYKGYCCSVTVQTFFIVLPLLGIYTVLLHSFGLYEILNYNSQSQIGFGSMLSFISFGMIFMGSILSLDYFPHPPEKSLMETPEKVDTSKAQFSSEHHSLFSSHDSDSI